MCVCLFVFVCLCVQVSRRIGRVSFNFTCILKLFFFSGHNLYMNILHPVYLLRLTISKTTFLLINNVNNEYVHSVQNMFRKLKKNTHAQLHYSRKTYIQFVYPVKESPL